MLFNLTPDNDIARERLTDGRMEQYEVNVEPNGHGVAITCGDSKMLVRFDGSGNVAKLIPLDNGHGTKSILLALGGEFHVTFAAGYEDAYYVLDGDAE
jgi:hypothetical protein